MGEKSRINRYKDLREKIENQDPSVFEDQNYAKQDETVEQYENKREQLDNTTINTNREYEIKNNESEDGITSTVAFSLDEILAEYKKKGKPILDEPKNTVDKKINVLLIITISFAAVLLIAIIVIVILFATGVL